MPRERADRLLVALGHFDSRASARAAIEAGCVTADGKPVTRPSEKLLPEARIVALPAHPYVSRGGLKLAHALDVFGVDPAGRTCLDLGASTGGFTQVLLARGAGHVVAVDVGRDQFHTRLRGEPRVSLHEGRDARTLEAGDLPQPPGLIVADVSFISLSKLLEIPLSLAAGRADLVALFKPQFEVGRAHIGKGGRVRPDAPVDAAAAALGEWLAGQGWAVAGWTDSPIAGGDGNAERLIQARRLP